MNNFKNQHSCWYIEQSNYLSGPVVHDKIYDDISIANRVDPDQVSLLQELYDVVLLCLQKRLNASL